MARMIEKMKVLRLLTTVSGSPSASTGVAAQQTRTRAAYSAKARRVRRLVRGISILLRCMGIPPWISKHDFRLFGCRQEIIHVQQFVVLGIACQSRVGIRRGGVCVRRRAAIFGESDVRVPEQVVLPVYDRTFSTNKQQRLVIGKQAHFVGGHQVAGCLLAAGTA